MWSNSFTSRGVRGARLHNHPSAQARVFFVFAFTVIGPRIRVGWRAPALGALLLQGAGTASRQGCISRPFAGYRSPIRNRVKHDQRGPSGAKPIVAMLEQRPLRPAFTTDPRRRGLIAVGPWRFGDTRNEFRVASENHSPGTVSQTNGMLTHACAQHEHEHDNRCPGRCCLPPTPATSGQTCASASSTLSNVARRSASTNRAGNHVSIIASDPYHVIIKSQVIRSLA